jgi:hypothetical protein
VADRAAGARLSLGAERPTDAENAEESGGSPGRGADFFRVFRTLAARSPEVSGFNRAALG